MGSGKRLKDWSGGRPVLQQYAYGRGGNGPWLRTEWDGGVSSTSVALCVHNDSQQQAIGQHNLNDS